MYSAKSPACTFPLHKGFSLSVAEWVGTYVLLNNAANLRRSIRKRSSPHPVPLLRLLRRSSPTCRLRIRYEVRNRLPVTRWSEDRRKGTKPPIPFAVQGAIYY